MIRPSSFNRGVGVASARRTVLLGMLALCTVLAFAVLPSSPARASSPFPELVRALLVPLAAIDKPEAFAHLTPYVDALDVPRIAVPLSSTHARDYYEIQAVQFTQKLHRDLPPTTLWGYDDGAGGGACFPGPTIVAHKNKPVQVKWINNLPPPGNHPLPVDYTIPPLNTGAGDDRIVTHLHGAKVPADSDGTPWQDYPPGNSAIFTYPNQMTARLMWYHDHAMGITRLNTQAGLAAGYLLTDAHEASLNLPGPPGSAYDLPIIITDKVFLASGKQWYPKKYPDPTLVTPVPSIVSEFFGTVELVNGKVWPYANVQPRKYRLRILAAASNRFYNLALYVENPDASHLGAGVPVQQIGTEGGFIPAPITINPATGVGGNHGKMLLSPAERADVVVDFTGLANQKVVLTNDAVAPFPTGGMDAPDPAKPGTPGQLMEFRVGPGPTPDPSTVPPKLISIPRLGPGQAAASHRIGLFEVFDTYGRLWQFLGVDGPQQFLDPVSEFVKLGTIEKWQFVNTTADVHPIHTHEFTFQVIERRPLNLAQYLLDGSIHWIGPSVTLFPEEVGSWKETVKAYPGMVTTVLLDARVGYPGKYVYHCHILTHEDHDMMRPFVVNP